ncbi:MAG: ABC transporter, ATP-binding protein [uncultured Cytophagales bacterium]|uniref:ABC transporter, ATP-binding protein n=1 Tax=uncultured Cytophagales bacterium TaxID=158755 RepID=A0A6J4JN39_9SPHI|nr:MAG: ABC transporter, ATP-binding protein [uncultured Cytophagales bacterium]
MIAEPLQETAPAPEATAEVVLSVENVSKRFCRDLKRAMYYGVKDMMSEMLGMSPRRDCLRKNEFWALKDVSFELRQGEAVGLVGANGAGKTTLLKLISGLIKPDTGKITVKGKVAPLIALGAGFNPVLTGRENVFINMAILGLTRSEIEDRYEEVVAFSEIGPAIDAPVNTYSSGMRARLGFACAIHTTPDILLIDEVLAVGDVKFRMKCYRRLAQLRERGTSFILVSHGTQTILSTCNKGVYLSRGKVMMTGQVGEVLSRYEEELFDNPARRGGAKLTFPEKAEQDSYGVDILEVFFRDEQGNPQEELISGKPARLCLRCKVHKHTPAASVKIIIRELAQENNYMLSLDSADDETFFELFPGITELKLHLPAVGLKRGLYSSKINIAKGGIMIFDAVENFQFTVRAASRDMIESAYYQVRSWEQDGELG